MPKKQPAPRFEVLINGKKAATAGIAGYGVMHVIVGRVKRNPKRFPRDGKSAFSRAQWSKEQIDVNVGGLDINARDEHLHWLRRDLKAGDEITVRVLAAGKIDKPKR
jgi:hypothetical protein